MKKKKKSKPLKILKIKKKIIKYEVGITDGASARERAAAPNIAQERLREECTYTMTGIYMEAKKQRKRKRKREDGSTSTSDYVANLALSPVSCRPRLRRS